MSIGYVLCTRMSPVALASLHEEENDNEDKGIRDNEAPMGEVGTPHGEHRC